MLRRFAASVCLVLATLLTLPAFAQPFPSKIVRIIVPVPPGGLSDILARHLATELTAVWGQRVIVENRPGANTILAAEATAKSPPDGYTLLFTTPPAMSSNQFLFKKLGYDAERDLIPVFNIAYAPPIFITNAKVPANTLQEFISLAKSKPGILRYGSFGVGSVANIDTEILSMKVGMKLNHVPYKGISEVLPALVTDEVQFGYAGIPPALSFISRGEIKALAVSAPKRVAVLPNVPTLDEAGVHGLDLRGWFGIVAPGGTPKPIVDKIAKDLSEITGRKEFQDKAITGVGLMPMFQMPDQFEAFLTAERARNREVIRELNISLD